MPLYRHFSSWHVSHAEHVHMHACVHAYLCITGHPCIRLFPDLKPEDPDNHSDKILAGDF